MTYTICCSPHSPQHAFRILTFYGAFRRPCLRAVTSLVTFQLLSSYRIKGIVSHLPSRKSCQGWGLARKEAWRLQQLGQFASALVSLASPRATAWGKGYKDRICVCSRQYHTWLVYHLVNLRLDQFHNLQATRTKGG